MLDDGNRMKPEFSSIPNRHLGNMRHLLSNRRRVYVESLFDAPCAIPCVETTNGASNAQLIIVQYAMIENCVVDMICKQNGFGPETLR